MPAPTAELRDLGARLRARRVEAGIDVQTLALRASVGSHEVDAFEGGHGGLGVGALMRLAKALGVPSTSFVHTNAPVVRALIEPSVLLKGSGAAWLNDADRDALASALRRARAHTEVGELLGSERLADEFHPSEPSVDRPFLHGADVALRVRALMPERRGPIRNLARLLEDRFDTLVLRQRFSDQRVLGAACRSGRARLVAVNTNLGSETARRFVLAHELGHHVLDLEESGATADEGVEPARFWLDNHPREKRANAFAAMLLAPGPSVAELVGPPRFVGAYDEAKRLIESVRTHFGAGFAAVAWHLHNLRYFDEGMARMLLLAAPDADPVTGFEDGDTKFDGLHRRTFDALSRGLISRARARELLDGEDLDAYLAS